MTPVVPVYNYTVEQQADYTLLSYTKTPISKSLIGPLCFFTAIPAGFATVLARPQSFGAGAVIWGLWMAALGYAIVLLINYLRTKTPVQLRLSKSTIVSGNNTYDFTHISAILLKDPKGRATVDSSLLQTPLVSPYSLAGGITHLSTGLLNASRESMFAIKKYFNEVQYTIGIRYGSKEIDIAKGLGDTDAQVLFDKITELTGYNKPH